MSAITDKGMIVWADKVGGSEKYPRKSEIRDWAVTIDSVVGEQAEITEGFAERAELAASMAANSAGIYPTTAAGIAATTNGQYFSIPGADPENYTDLYQNVSGVATYVDSYPNSQAINDKADAAFTQSTDYPNGTLSDKATQSISLSDPPFNCTGTGIETAKVQAAFDAANGRPVYVPFNVTVDADITSPSGSSDYGPGQIIKAHDGGTVLAFHGLPKAPRSWGRHNLAKLYTRVNEPGATLTVAIFGDSKRAPLEGDFTGSIAGTTLNVQTIPNAVPAVFAIGTPIVGPGVVANQKVVGYIPAADGGGNGGVGTYVVAIAQADTGLVTMTAKSGGGFVDFTPAGFIGQGAEPQNLWRDALKARGFENNIIVRNRAVGGVGASYLNLVDSFLREPFDICEICLPTNDAVTSTNAAAIAVIEAEIARFRAMVGAVATVSNVAIVLTVPPSSNEPASKRDDQWFAANVLPMFSVGIKHDCFVHNAFDLAPTTDWFAQATGGLMSEDLNDVDPVAFPYADQYVHWRIGGTDLEHSDKFNEMMPPGMFNAFLNDKWIPATGANSWVPGNGGTSWMPLRQRRSKNGDLEAIGAVQSGTPTNGVAVTAADGRMAPSTPVPYWGTTPTGQCRMIWQTDGSHRQADGNASSTYIYINVKAPKS